jgi:tetratricopeptide (TPR) repeat protein
MKNPLRHLVSMACVLLAASSAQAKDADAKERAAKIACLAGDYAKGVALLSEIYVSTNDPVFVYDQGRCFEQNHRYEDAISRFREYLRVGRQISRTERADAQKDIADCEKLLGKQGGATPAPTTEAARGDSRAAKEKAAKKACLSGDADAGVALLTDLYIDNNDANLIFNQARCFEQSERCGDAIARFHEYLRKIKDAGTVSDGRAERHIADCEQILKKAKGGEGPSLPAVIPQPRQGSTASTALGITTDLPGGRSAGPGEGMGASTGQAGVQSSLPQRVPGRGLRISGGVTFAVGVAGIAAGMGFALAANHLADELEERPARYQPSKESLQSSYATASTVGYVAGAVCLAGGALLYYLGWRKGHESSATIEPMVSAQTAGARVAVAF